MQTFTQLPQYYQAPNGTTNPQIRWGKCVGFRAAPTPPPGTNSPTEFYWPRTVRMNDGASCGLVTIGDTGWIPGDFTSLTFNSQDKGVGTALQDWWNVWIAESDEDMLIAAGSSFTAGLVYDPSTGLYTSQDLNNGVISGTVAVSSVSGIVDTFGATWTNGNTLVQGNQAVVSGTPVNVTGKLSPGAGDIVSMIFSITSATAASVLHISLGGSGNAGYYLQAPAAGGTSLAIVPPPNPSGIQIWLEASTGTIQVEMTAMYQ